MEQIYLFCLVLFGGLAAISVLGDVTDLDVADLDVDADVDPGVDAGADLAAEPDGALVADGAAEAGAEPGLEPDAAAEKIFSIRGALYALFGFGLTGTLLTAAGAGALQPLTVGLSVASGLGAGWLVTRMLGWIRSGGGGRRAGDRSFVGCLGRVTLPLDPGESESGRVRVHRGPRTYDLRALPHPSAASGTDPGEWEEVLVVDVHDGVALVAPADDDELSLEP